MDTRILQCMRQIQKCIANELTEQKYTTHIIMSAQRHLNNLTEVSKRNDDVACASTVRIYTKYIMSRNYNNEKILHIKTSRASQQQS